MSNAPIIIDLRNTPRPGHYGFTTFKSGQINFPMVMHNAHQRAKAERNGWIEFAKSNPGYVVKSYREYFAVELRDQMRDAHSMSTWKRANAAKETPVQFKQAAE